MSLNFWNCPCLIWAVGDEPLLVKVGTLHKGQLGSANMSSVAQHSSPPIWNFLLPRVGVCYTTLREVAG